MLVSPTTLRGTTIQLEPLSLTHAPNLLACTARDTFNYFPKPPRTWDLSGFESMIQFALDTPDRLAFAVRLLSTNKVVGSTSYLEIRPEHRTLEIGWTFYSPECRGTLVNPESKFLLLRHAFETFNAIRVQLRTDARNLQSQAAIAKLGAIREGTLRHNVIMPDGHLRDTVLFSILDSEWPEVKKRLESRLAPVGSRSPSLPLPRDSRGRLP